MTGVPTQLAVLDVAVQALKSSSNARLTGIASLIEQNLPYASLGATALNMADFLPGTPPPSSQLGGTSGQLGGRRNGYLSIWQALLPILTGDGTDADKGLIGVLRSASAVLNQLNQITNDEDVDALKGLSGDEIQQTLAAVVPQIQNIQNVIPELTAYIESSKPIICGPPQKLPPLPSGPIKAWQYRDFLRWTKTGEFAKNLLTEAQASSDDTLLAFAYGYIVGLVTNVCVQPHVNSVVNGPYRTQWWRHRWVCNYIDTWVYGYYGQATTMQGDIPTPPYPNWRGLCGANLHQRISFTTNNADPYDVARQLIAAKFDLGTFPQLLPDNVAQLWITSLGKTYGQALPVQLDLQGMNAGYTYFWIMLWVQTSSDAIGCSSASQSPPGNCGTSPPWVQPNPGGGAGNSAANSGPPALSPSTFKKKTASNIIGLILKFLLGAGLRGLISGPAGIPQEIDALKKGSVDWSKLTCTLYWYSLYFQNATDEIRQLLKLGGLGFPEPRDLVDKTAMIPWLPIDAWEAGSAVAKSGPYKEDFPSKPWDGTSSTWLRRANEGLGNDPGIEQQPKHACAVSGAYPSWCIDDQNNKDNPIVGFENAWPLAVQAGNSEPVPLGSVINNVTAILDRPDLQLPNWNLDGDRGLGFHTWQMHAGLYAEPIAIDPEP